MDFVRLGERYTTMYEPDELIEGYSSLIWTERKLEFGEFELKTFDISRLATLLPEDTLVSHLETQDVMQVETHEINMVGEGADAVPELTIRGRAATTIFENRWVESTYQKKRKMRKKYDAQTAAAVLMYNAVVNSSGADITRGDNDPDTDGVINDYPWTTKDVLPNVAITESTAATGNLRWWQLDQGVLWPQLYKILDDADIGLRCLRPVSPNPATVITVQSALATRGTVVRTESSDLSKLRFDLYSGVDRTEDIQLSHLQGHLDEPTYLTSSRDHKTALEVMSGVIEVKDVYRAGEGSLSGWQRKVMGFDAGSPEIPPEPKETSDKWPAWKNKRDTIVADFREEQSLAALRELKKARRIDMFSGDVSSLSPYIYKKDYDLGDLVTLHGDYGKSAEMLVVEYVRTEDRNGDRGFPGLVLP